MLRARLALVAAFFSFAVPTFASITGSVLNYDGQPVAGAKVSIYTIESPDARRARWLSKTPQRAPLASTTTDSKGAFTIASPKEPAVDLIAEASGYAPDLTRIENDEQGFTAALIKAPMQQGTVTANGKPVAGATVIWLSGSESIATTDAAGHYSVPRPDKWASRVIVLHPDYAIREDAFGGPLKATADQKIDAGVALTGRVVNADGKTPAAGATLTIDSWPSGKTAEDGSFNVAHAPKKWEVIEARAANSVAARASNGTMTLMKLAPAASITGVIRDAKTLAPLAGVDVRLARNMTGQMRFGMPSTTVGTITDAKGGFTLSGIRGGDYELIASRPGYSFARNSTTLTAGQKLAKTIAGTQNARVAGTVLDDDKRPVAGAIISVQSVSRDQFSMGPRFAAGGGDQSVMSGTDGRFTMSTSREGDSQIEAAKRGYPNARSSTMRLASGERKSGVILTIPRGVALTGRVADANGKPISGVIVTTAESQGGPGGGMRRMMMAMRGGDNEEENVQTASDGTFTVRVKEGTYDVAFRREGFAPKTLRSQQISSSTRPVDVTLEQGVEITGRVTRSGNPIADVNIGAMGSDAQTFVTTGPDGRFTISDLNPGSYMVIVNKQEDFIQQMKTISAPAHDVVIDLPAGGRVVGHVVDKSTHRPVTTFTAGVSTSRSGGGMMIMTPPMLKSFTSDDGSFVLENVPTGNMQVVANASGYTTGRVPSVVIEEGKTTSDIEVALETGAKLTGRVTGPDGAALSGVNVRQGGDQMRMMMGTDASAVTDANGDYTIDSLEQGEKTFVFGRGGYLNETKTVNIASKETRLDVQLSTGLRVTGQVVTEAGVPVGDASVRASSASASGFGKGTRTDSSGNFTLEGVAPGHYTFTASKDGYADAISRDVDVSSGASIRLALKTGGVVFGHITGVPAEDLSRVTVNIRSTSGGGSEATVDPSGNFRLEGAPTGTLRVSAEMMRGFTDRRTTEVRIVELAPGGSVQADLEFNTQTVIRGRVTRNGAAVGSAGVMFMPMPGSTTATTARTTTDDAGNYTVSGLGDARYNVTVVESRLNPYNTSYEVHGSSNFDIDIKAASLRGRVIDSATNDPIADAVVQLRKKADMSDMAMFASRTATTDANGVFVMEAISAGTYVASAEKQGWGSSKNDVVVGDSAPQDVELRLAKNDGVLLKVVDGRDGRTLAAQAVALDASGQIAYDSPMFGGGTEPLRLSLAPGQYRVIVAAQGYAAQSVTVTSPSQPTIALTPGGTVVVHSSATSSLRARLVNSSGIVYARPYNRDGIFMVAGENTSVFNVQPGRYKLQILEGGAVVKTMDVVVTEGGTVSADI